MIALVASLAGAIAGLVLALRARRYPGLRGAFMRLAAIGVAAGAQVVVLWLLGPIAMLLLFLVVAAFGYWWYLEQAALPFRDRSR